MEIHELMLATPALNAQRAFYTDVLGLPLLHDDGSGFAVAVGASRLVFTRATDAAPAHYHYAINVPVVSFDAAVEWLRARTPLLHNAAGETVMTASNWPARMVYFADPDGNIGELIARDDLATDTMTSVILPLLHLSEVGLAATDPLALVAQIQQTIGLPAYRDAPDPNFSAIGDARGLCIVVPTGRLWYPEQRVPATAAPLTARVSYANRTWQIAGPPWQISAIAQ